MVRNGGPPLATISQPGPYRYSGWAGPVCEGRWRGPFAGAALRWAQSQRQQTMPRFPTRPVAAPLPSLISAAPSTPHPPPLTQAQVGLVRAGKVKHMCIQNVDPPRTFLCSPRL